MISLYGKVGHEICFMVMVIFYLWLWLSLSRLQYFARVSQAYQKRLREALANKKGEELKTEENKIKLIALKTTANINALIRDLFHQPPSYKVCSPRVCLNVNPLAISLVP